MFPIPCSLFPIPCSLFPLVGGLAANGLLFLVENFVAEIVGLDLFGEFLLLRLPGGHFGVRQLALHRLFRLAGLFSGGGLYRRGLFQNLVLRQDFGNEFARFLSGGVEGFHGLPGEALRLVFGLLRSGFRRCFGGGFRRCFGGGFSRFLGLFDGGVGDVADIFGEAGEKPLLGRVRGLGDLCRGLFGDRCGLLHGLVDDGGVGLVCDIGDLARGLLKAAGGGFEEIRERLALGDADLVGEGALLAVVEVHGDDTALGGVRSVEMDGEVVGDFEPDAEFPCAVELELREGEVVGDAPRTILHGDGVEVDVPWGPVVVGEDGEPRLGEPVVVAQGVDELEEAEGGECVGIAGGVCELDVRGVVGHRLVDGPGRGIGEAARVAENEPPMGGAVRLFEEPVEGDFVCGQAFDWRKGPSANLEGGVHLAVERGADAGVGTDGGDEAHLCGDGELRGAETGVFGIGEKHVERSVRGRRHGGDGIVARQGIAEAHAVAERVADGGHFKFEDGFGIVESEAALQALDGEGLALALDAEFGAGTALARGGEREEDAFAFDEDDVARGDDEAARGQVAERRAGGDCAGEKEGRLPWPNNENGGEDGEDD